MTSICIKCNNSNTLNSIFFALEKSKLSNIYFSKHRFKIFENIIIHYCGKNIESFYSFISQILYTQIIKYYEAPLVVRILNQNYFYFDETDKKIIVDEFNLLKERAIYNESFVENIIIKEIISFISSNKNIILHGFVNFRLYSYKKYLEDMVNESVNQYLIDKEYVRFVNMLKNYVSSRIPSEKCFHLIYTNSNAMLISNEGNMVELESFKSNYVSDISFSKNDLILNTLVSHIPQKIIIHLVSPKDQFIKTIEMIFTNQVQICNGCNLCKTYKILENK